MSRVVDRNRMRRFLAMRSETVGAEACLASCPTASRRSGRNTDGNNKRPTCVRKYECSSLSSVVWSTTRSFTPAVAHFLVGLAGPGSCTISSINCGLIINRNPSTVLSRCVLRIPSWLFCSSLIVWFRRWSLLHIWLVRRARGIPYRFRSRLRIRGSRWWVHGRHRASLAVVRSKWVHSSFQQQPLVACLSSLPRSSTASTPCLQQPGQTSSFPRSVS